MPGHREGDPVIGGDMRSCLLTLVERSTRFLLARKFDLHPTELVTSELAKMASELPRDLMRSVTWDQGAEMAGHVDPVVLIGQREGASAMGNANEMTELEKLEAGLEYDFWDAGVNARKLRAVEECKRLNDIDPTDDQAKVIKGIENGVEQQSVL